MAKLINSNNLTENISFELNTSHFQTKFEDLPQGINALIKLKGCGNAQELWTTVPPQIGKKSGRVLTLSNINPLTFDKDWDQSLVEQGNACYVQIECAK